MIEGNIIDDGPVSGSVSDMPVAAGASDVTAVQVQEWDADTLGAAADAAAQGDAATLASANLYTLEQVAEVVLYALESRELAAEGDREIAERLDALGITDVDQLTEALDQLATGLAGKSPLGHTHDAATLVGLNAALVGLANVDNTRDMAKPVSTLQAAAIALRAPLSHTHTTGQVSGLDSALAGKAGTTDVQIFEPSGVPGGPQSTFVWTKPAGAKRVEIVAVGGGGGGGGGRQGAAGTVRTGGGGGAAGQASEFTTPATLLPPTLSITVGNGGAGGAAATTPDTNGGNGGGPGQTLVRTPDNAVTLVAGYQGAAGTGGSQAAANGGSAPNYSNIATGGPSGGASPAGGGTGGSTSINDTSRWPNSGGAGGGISTAEVAGLGGGGGRNVSGMGGYPGNTPAGANAPDALDGYPFSLAAAGGGAGVGRAGGNGGKGGKYGGGGGGGGASTNGFPSGRGGDGGPGGVIITTWF